MLSPYPLVLPTPLMPSPPACAGPAQQPEEERAADQGGEHAERQLGGLDERSGGEVARDQDHRPASALPGTRNRWPGPAAMRSRCGTTSPTKPMTPVTVTAAAVSSATTRIRTIRSRSTSTPRCRAGRSPRASRSSSARAEGRDDQPEHGARQHREHLRPGGLGEGAELPEGDLVDRRRVREEDEQADQRAGEGVDRDAGEDQRDDLVRPPDGTSSTPAATVTEPRDERERRQASSCRGR